jgi:hypothetical protein
MINRGDVEGLSTVILGFEHISILAERADFRTLQSLRADI